MFCKLKAQKSLLFLSCILGLAIACKRGDNSALERKDFGFFKSPDSQQACLSKNLSQWSLSGPFLNKLLHCAAIETTDGGSTLPRTLAWADALGPDKMQALSDFLLTEDLSASDHAGRYPYLLAFSTLLDRGLKDGSAAGIELTQERLGDMQGFLLALPPERPKWLLTQWSQSGKLNRLLQELGFFIASLKEDNLQVLVNEALQGHTLRKPFFAMSHEVLGNDRLMEALDASLSGNETFQLGPERMQAFELGRQAELPKSGLLPHVWSSADKTPDLTPAAHLAAFSAQLSEQELGGLSQFLLSFWEAYRSQDSGAQKALNQRLVGTFEEAIDQQRAPALWLLSLLHDVRSLPVRDLDEITTALGRLVSEEGVRSSWDSTLDTLRAKVGTQKMIDGVVQKIVDGGSIRSCGGLTVSPLERSAQPPLPQLLQRLQWLTQANDACQGLAPLAVAMADELDVSLQSDCSTASGTRPCVPLNGNSARPAATTAWQSIAEPKAEIWLRLVETSLAEQRRWLGLDPYSLKHQGLAYDAVSLASFDKIWQSWQAQDQKTLPALAEFDRSLQDKEELRGLLIPDFLEKVLTFHIERLAALSGQTYDLVPETDGDKSTTQRAMRAFAGLYNRGPLEEALRHRLAPARWLQENPPSDARLSKAFQDHPEWLSRIFARLQFGESVFRSPMFASLGNEDLTPFVSLGSSLTNFTSIEPSPREGRRAASLNTSTIAQNEVLQPLQSIRRFDSTSASSASGWALWDWQLASSALTSKDLPPELMGAYQSWVQNELIPRLASADTWSELMQAEAPQWSQLPSGVSQEFYDVTGYSPEEARILALYQLRHYLKLPQSVPSASSISSAANPSPGSTSFTAPIRGFMNASYMSSPGSDYLLFAKLVPDSLRSPALTSLEDMQNQALPSFEQYQTEGGFFPYAKQSLIRDVSKFRADSLKPSLRLFSSLNLLTFTRSGLNFYPQALIGLGGQNCQSSATEKIACPVELNAGSQAEAYALYQDFIRQQIAQYFCPLLAGTDLGDPLLWQKRLGLRVSKPETCAGLTSVASLPADSLRFPAWMSKRVLQDIFTLGRTAHLKEGIAQLPASLRYYKLAAQNLDGKTLSQRWLRESSGVWDELNAASQSRRQKLAFAFWAGAPSLMSSYTDSLRLGLGTDEWKQSLVGFAERTESGADSDALRKVLRRFIAIQKSLRTSDAKVSDLLLQMLDELRHEKSELDFLTALASNYTQLETYDFLGNELPLAVLGLFEDRFDWNQPGLRLLKFVAQAETLNVLGKLTHVFSTQELQGFIAVALKATQSLGNLSEQQHLANRTLDEVLSLGSLGRLPSGELLAESWNDVLKAWRQARFTTLFQTRWEELLLAWDKPLQRFDGSDSLSAQTVLAQGLPSLLRYAPALLDAHQQTGASSETLFWPRLLQDFLRTMEDETLGSRALAHFFATESLGFEHGTIWEKLFLEEPKRLRLVTALESATSVPQELWEGALEESTEVIGRLQKPLAFLKDHMKWKQDPGSNAFQKALDQLYALSQDPELRDRQIEVLGAWLRGSLNPEALTSKDSDQEN